MHVEGQRRGEWVTVVFMCALSVIISWSVSTIPSFVKQYVWSLALETFRRTFRKKFDASLIHLYTRRHELHCNSPKKSIFTAENPPRAVAFTALLIAENWARCWIVHAETSKQVNFSFVHFHLVKIRILERFAFFSLDRFFFRILSPFFIDFCFSNIFFELNHLVSC
jgi:hypothetical protein